MHTVRVIIGGGGGGGELSQWRIWGDIAVERLSVHRLD